ncbi:MAG: potassium channel family protein [Planctomycetota bacterium]
MLPSAEIGGAAERAIVGLVSALATVLSVLFHYEVMSITSARLPAVRLRRRARIVALMLALMAAHMVEVWIFAGAFWVLSHWPSTGVLVGPSDGGVFDCVYFSVTAFTTVGFGDLVPRGPIRILSGTEAIAGLGLITWSASLAFLEMQRDWREYRIVGRRGQRR